MRAKRAQAAMEFLMTYGWAILVVLVVIGALAYFGILNPSNLLPERCEVQMGLYCKDHAVKPISGGAEILLTLENGRGNDIYITNLTLSNDQLQCTVTNTSTRLLKNGDKVSIRAAATNAQCSQISQFSGANTKLKWNIEIKWYSLGSTAQYTHTARGQLQSGVE